MFFRINVRRSASHGFLILLSGERGRVVPKDRPIANFEELIDFDDDDEDDLVAALGGTPKEKPKKVKRYDTASPRRSLSLP